MPSDPIIITIDGAAASGKSTTARHLAEALDLLHVDTGAHYRTLTRVLLDKGIQPERLTSDPSALGELMLDTGIEGRRSTLLVNGASVPDAMIRTEAINQSVSLYAAQPAVRNCLLEYQRSQANVALDRGFRGIVMEGRDIGSVVFPDARFRYYLFADPSTRQQRRDNEGLADSVTRRDEIDSSRTQAPLKIPDGSVLIDTGAMDVDSVVHRICSDVNASGQSHFTLGFDHSHPQ